MSYHARRRVGGTGHKARCLTIWSSGYPEIPEDPLEKIVSYLDDSASIMSCRLVCRAFSNVGKTLPLRVGHFIPMYRRRNAYQRFVVSVLSSHTWNALWRSTSAVRDQLYLMQHFEKSISRQPVEKSTVCAILDNLRSNPFSTTSADVVVLCSSPWVAEHIVNSPSSEDEERLRMHLIMRMQKLLRSIGLQHVDNAHDTTAPCAEQTAYAEMRRLMCAPVSSWVCDYSLDMMEKMSLLLRSSTALDLCVEVIKRTWATGYNAEHRDVRCVIETLSDVSERISTGSYRDVDVTWTNDWYPLRRDM